MGELPLDIYLGYCLDYEKCEKKPFLPVNKWKTGLNIKKQLVCQKNVSDDVTRTALVHFYTSNYLILWQLSYNKSKRSSDALTQCNTALVRNNMAQQWFSVIIWWPSSDLLFFCSLSLGQYHCVKKKLLLCVLWTSLQWVRTIEPPSPKSIHDVKKSEFDADYGCFYKSRQT